MSEQVLEHENKALQARATATRKAQPKQDMFGIPELVGLAFAGLLVFLVIISYLYFLMPANSRLKRLQDEKVELERGIKTLGSVVDINRTNEEIVKEKNESVVNFERNHLRQYQVGRMSLYQELNQTMLRNGLRNTDGPTYTALEPIDPNATRSQANKAGIARWQSLFPGINVTVTVEGSYMNLRRFIRDIESNGQFVIINAVQLEGQANSDAPIIDNVDPMTGNPKTPQPTEQGKHGSNVSLRLDMAIYFQRGNSGGS